MTADAPRRVVVTDANIIINLIHARRLALLGALQASEFIVPEDVACEIVDPAQREELEAAITAGLLTRETVTAPHELAQYAELRQVVGRGEAACLALAESREWLIASDEKRRFRREVLARLGSGRLVTAPGLLVLAIRAGVISVEEADEAKAILERNRFRMGFRSFREVIERTDRCPAAHLDVRGRRRDFPTLR